jgi:hypothetical protein
MTVQTRHKIIVLAAILVGGAAIWSALTAYISPHCVPLDRLAAVRAGMTKQEVVALLGPPQSDKKTAANQRELWYWQRWRYCSVCIHFDGDDRVQTCSPNNEPSIFHDH